MSEFTDHDEPEEDSPKGLRRMLEAELAARKAAEEKAAKVERELAFAKAGIDLADPKTKYFVAGYDGEIDPEKIRAAALDAGFLAPPEPQVLPEELAQHQQVAALAAGAQAVDFDQNAEYQTAISQARSKEEVLALMDRFGSPRTSRIV